MEKILLLLMSFVLMSCAQMQSKLNQIQGKVDPNTPYKNGDTITVSLDDTPYNLVPNLYKANGTVVEEQALIDKDLAGKTFDGQEYSSGGKSWIVDIRVKRNGIKGKLYFKIKDLKVPPEWIKNTGVFSKLSFVGKVTNVSGKCASGETSSMREGDICYGHNEAFVDEIQFIRWSKKTLDEYASIAKGKSLAKSQALKSKNIELAEFQARRAKNPKQTEICDDSHKKLIVLRTSMASSSEVSESKRINLIKKNKDIISTANKCAFELDVYSESMKDDVSYFDKCMEYYLKGAGQDMFCK